MSVNGGAQPFFVSLPSHGRVSRICTIPEKTRRKNRDSGNDDANPEDVDTVAVSMRGELRQDKLNSSSPLNNFLNDGIEPVKGLRGKRQNPVQKIFPPSSSESCIHHPSASMTKKKGEVEEEKRTTCVTRREKKAQNKEAFLVGVSDDEAGDPAVAGATRGRSSGEEGENRKDRLDEDSVVQRRLFCYPAERAISSSLFLTRLADPLFSPISRLLAVLNRSAADPVLYNRHKIFQWCIAEIG
ncbi:hypothetical protein EAI_01751 [Harpegnathos saltator]|uniref:Uncharacterized protein n=1 Tax=Harpegnathos saltator TaxID=610380 RepID=E2BBQ2_HARSA|nr:hypothetical protein EAI_01751 [Harpegnathos saltator]